MAVILEQAVGRGTRMLADRVEHYVNLAREVGDVLREREEPAAADIVQMLAQQGTQIARYLRNNDGSRLWNDAQTFSRDKTWVLAGIGLVGGLAAARTIRFANGSNGFENPEFVDSYAQPRRYQE